MTPDVNRMHSAEEARAKIFARLRRLDAERVSLEGAASRILDSDIIAHEDQPPFAASTMDGYAVVAEDPSPWREIVGAQRAGTIEDLRVELGTAAWVTTGAPIPPGATAVVPVEETERADDHVVIHRDGLAPGDYIRPIGIDIAKGSTVLCRGTMLGPAEIGILAGLGIDPVTVVLRPRVSVLSTGDELVDPWQTPGPGQIRDSNRFSLIAALRDAGAEVVWAGRGPDQLSALRELFLERVEQSDVIVTSGGVSMGDLDLVKPLLGELAEVHFRRVLLKPGKPLNFATIGETLVFSLPGNPVSALVGFEVFLRPALRAMLGASDVDRPRVPVRITHDVQPSDRPEMQRAIVSVTQQGDLCARTTGVQSSSRLTSFVGANALLHVPTGQQSIPAGSRMEAMLINPIVAEPYT